MKKIYNAILISLFIAFTLNPSASADEMIGVKAGFITLDAGGDIAVSTAGIGGTNVDVDTVLNLERAYRGTGEIYLQLGDFRASASYLPLKFTGNAALTVPVTFNGVTFPVTTPVESSLEAEIIDLGLTYFLLNFDDLPSRLQIGVETAVKIVVAEASIQSLAPAPAASASTSETIPIPTIGLRGRIALGDFLGLTGRVGGLAYSGNHFIDSEIQVEFSPLPNVGAFAGYRYIKLKVDESGVFVDTHFDGPLVGIFARF